jgi:transcriptional regulator with XRE-family HTH domain
MVLDANMIRAGRAALNWSVADLARESGVSVVTIHRIEAENGEPAKARQDSRDKLLATFKAHRVTFAAVRGGWQMTVRGR